MLSLTNAVQNQRGKMCKVDFNNKLNKVFTLMLENKFREDMDDTLLEKLLSIIKEGIHETERNHKLNTEGFIEKLLIHTQVLHLIEKVTFSLKSKDIKLSLSVKVFTLRLMSLIFEKEDVFVSQKNSVLLVEFSNTFNSNGPILIYPSIQDAVLTFIFSIAKHPEGTIWLIEQNLLDYALSCFSCPSYHVRKTAVNSFAAAFSLWTSSEFGPLSPPQQSILNDTIQRIVSQIIAEIQFSEDLGNATVSECCILTLKQSLESENIYNLVCANFHLIEKISKYFRNLTQITELNESVLRLLLGIFHRDNSIEPVIKEVIETLVSHEFFIPAIYLASSFLKISEVYKPLSSNHLQFLLMPLHLLSGNTSSDKEEDDVFHITSSAIYETLAREMKNKPKCIKLTSSALTGLSELTSFMDPQAVEMVLKSMEGILKEPLTSADQNPFMSSVGLGNRNICFSILELFSCLLADTVYSTLNLHSQLMLIDYLLCFMERPSFDNNILSEVLRLLKCLTALNAKCCVPLHSELKEKFTELLCRKLLDNKEPIVDNSLHLAGEIITCEGNGLWKESVLKHSIHMIVWDIAFVGSHEGFIKASALKVIIDVCLVPYCWEDIKSSKGLDKVDVMKLLCHYFQDPDFFIQRESLSCIHKWIKFNEQVLSSCRETIFSILFCAINSLDLELKLTALDIWQWLLENNTAFSIPSTDINLFIKILCDSGFGTSLMLAIEDYDDAVKFKATNILLNLKQKLLLIGCSKEFLPFERTEEIVIPTNTEGSFFEKVSKDEKNAALDIVMKLTTTEQITNLCRISEPPGRYNFKDSNILLSKSDSVPCSVKSFWTYLWNEKLDSLFCAKDKSSSVFSEYSLSLLDDIIAAETTDHPVDDVPDCY